MYKKNRQNGCGGMRKKGMVLLIVLLGLAWYQTIGAALALPAEYQEHIQKAEAFAEKEIYEDALEEYELALALRPDDADLKLSIARTKLALGDKTSFIGDCEAMIFAEPMQEEALTELVGFYASDGKAGQIVELLEGLRERNPENAVVSELWKTYRGSYENLYSSYDYISSFYQNYAIAGNEYGFVVIDSGGERIFSDVYEEIGFCSAQTHVFPVKKDGIWYYVNEREHKKLVPDTDYEYVGMISEDCVVTGKGGVYSYTDMQFQPLTDQSWDAVTNMYHGAAAVSENGKWAIINREFEFLTDYIYEAVATDEMGFCSESSRIFVKQTDGWHLLNTDGEAVTSAVYEDARPFSREGVAAVCQDGVWGYLNEAGEPVIACQYEDAGTFQEGLAPVKRNGMWGYINMENEMVIEPVFEEARPFCEAGTAPVKDGNWFLIHLYALDSR